MNTELKQIECLKNEETLSASVNQKQFWFKHILFDQSLLHRYNIKEVGSDSKPWSFPNTV